MLILKVSKSKSSPAHGLTMEVQPNHKVRVTVPDNLQSKKYLFNFVSILSHITFLLTHTPILVSTLIKHKDGKTFKFLIRNIYFLLFLEGKQLDKDNEYLFKMQNNLD